MSANEEELEAETTTQLADEQDGSTPSIEEQKREFASGLERFGPGDIVADEGVLRPSDAAVERERQEQRRELRERLAEQAGEGVTVEDVTVDVTGDQFTARVEPATPEQDAREARIQEAKSRLRERFADRDINRIAPGTTSAGDVYATVEFESGETQFVDNVVSGGEGPEGTQLFRQTQDEAALDTPEDVRNFLTGRGIADDAIEITTVGGQPGAIIDAEEFEGTSEPDYFRDVSASGQFALSPVDEQALEEQRQEQRQQAREQLTTQLQEQYGGLLGGRTINPGDEFTVETERQDGQTVFRAALSNPFREDIEQARREDLRGRAAEQAGPGFSEQDIVIEETEGGGLRAQPGLSARLREAREEAAVRAAASGGLASSDAIFGGFQAVKDELSPEFIDEFQIEISAAKTDNRPIDVSIFPERLEDVVADRALAQGPLGADRDPIFEARERADLTEEQNKQFQVELSEAYTEERAIDVTDLPRPVQEELIKTLPQDTAETVQRETLRSEVIEQSGGQLAREDVVIEETEEGVTAGVTEAAQEREAVEDIQRQYAEAFGRELVRGEEFVLEETEEGGFRGELTEEFEREISGPGLAEQVEEQFGGLFPGREFEEGDEFRTVEGDEEGTVQAELTESFRQDIRRARYREAVADELRGEFAQIRNVFEDEVGPAEDFITVLGEDERQQRQDQNLFDNQAGNREGLQAFLEPTLVRRTSTIYPGDNELTPVSEFLQERAESEASAERRRARREFRAEVAEEQGVSFDDVTLTEQDGRVIANVDESAVDVGAISGSGDISGIFADPVGITPERAEAREAAARGAAGGLMADPVGTTPTIEAQREGIAEGLVGDPANVPTDDIEAEASELGESLEQQVGSARADALGVVNPDLRSEVIDETNLTPGVDYTVEREGGRVTAELTEGFEQAFQEQQQDIIEGNLEARIEAATGVALDASDLQFTQEDGEVSADFTESGRKKVAVENSLVVSAADALNVAEDEARGVASAAFDFQQFGREQRQETVQPALDEFRSATGLEDEIQGFNEFRADAGAAFDRAVQPAQQFVTDRSPLELAAAGAPLAAAEPTPVGEVGLGIIVGGAALAAGTAEALDSLSARQQLAVGQAVSAANTPADALRSSLTGSAPELDDTTASVPALSAEAEQETDRGEMIIDRDVIVDPESGEVTIPDVERGRIFFPPEEGALPPDQAPPELEVPIEDAARRERLGDALTFPRDKPLPIQEDPIFLPEVQTPTAPKRQFTAGRYTPPEVPTEEADPTEPFGGVEIPLDDDLEGTESARDFVFPGPEVPAPGQPTQEFADEQPLGAAGPEQRAIQRERRRSGVADDPADVARETGPGGPAFVIGESPRVAPTDPTLETPTADIDLPLVAPGLARVLREGPELTAEDIFDQTLIQRAGGAEASPSSVRGLFGFTESIEPRRGPVYEMVQTEEVFGGNSAVAEPTPPRRGIFGFPDEPPRGGPGTQAPELDSSIDADETGIGASLDGLTDFGSGLANETPFASGTVSEGVADSQVSTPTLRSPLDTSLDTDTPQIPGTGDPGIPTSDTTVDLPGYPTGTITDDPYSPGQGFTFQTEARAERRPPLVPNADDDEEEEPAFFGDRKLIERTLRNPFTGE